MSSKVLLRVVWGVAAAGLLPACGNVNRGHPTLTFTERVSVGPGGIQGNGAVIDARISADGRYVVFSTNATNLGYPVLPSGASQVFRRDLLLGVTQQVSVGPGPVSGDDNSSRASITADGRFVAFQSFATNLTSTAQANPQVYLRDMDQPDGSGITIVSQDPLGNPGNDFSESPSITPDAHYVAFDSNATNFGDVRTSGVPRIYRRDLTGTGIIPVSVTPTGGDPLASTTVAMPTGSVTASISDDGSVIAYASDCTNIVSNDTNKLSDVFVAKVGVGGAITTQLASVKFGGGSAGGRSISPSLSGDGLWVAFQSQAPDLLAVPPTPGFDSIYVFSVASGTVELDSVNSQGIAAEGADSRNPSLSADGRYMAFESTASNLVPGDTNGADDIFLHDRLLGTTIRVSLDTGGNQAGLGGNSSFPVLSSSGSGVVFLSAAAFENDDTNGLLDAYFRGPLF